MNKKSAILVALTLAILLSVTAIGWQKGSQRVGNSQTIANDNPHPSGAIGVNEFALLKDRAVIEEAVKNTKELKNFKLIRHVTGKRDKKTVVDSGFEITWVSPQNVYFFGDDNVTGKRMEIFQLGNIQYKSFDGTTWIISDTRFPKYSFLPEAIEGMYRDGKNFRLVSSDRQIDSYSSCTVVVFDRESSNYKGQTGQVGFWVDNRTKRIVRIEILDNEKKPLTYTEEVLRFSSFDDPELKIELYPEARAAK